MDDIEMGLDNSIASLTVLFNADRYTVVYSAYKMLNKVEVSIFARNCSVVVSKLVTKFLNGNLIAELSFWTIMDSQLSCKKQSLVIFQLKIRAFQELAMKIVGFTRATLERSARTVVIDRIISQRTDLRVDEMPYEQLCEVNTLYTLLLIQLAIISYNKSRFWCFQAIPTEDMLECVRELGFVMCKVLFTYHAILRYHVDDDEMMACTHQCSDGVY